MLLCVLASNIELCVAVCFANLECTLVSICGLCVIMCIILCRTTLTHLYA